VNIGRQIYYAKRKFISSEKLAKEVISDTHLMHEIQITYQWEIALLEGEKLHKKLNNRS